MHGFDQEEEYAELWGLFQMSIGWQAAIAALGLTALEQSVMPWTVKELTS